MQQGRRKDRHRAREAAKETPSSKVWIARDGGWAYMGDAAGAAARSVGYWTYCRNAPGGQRAVWVTYSCKEASASIAIRQVQCAKQGIAAGG